MSLVGIYSFPKSGNTWVRVILGQIMGKYANNIPDLHVNSLSDAAEFRGFRFFKHHGGQNFKMWKGQKLETTHVIHIRRNPLDVFVSYLNFVSDNVTGRAPIKFSSVDDIVGTDLFDMYFNTFVLTGHIAVEFAGVTGNYFQHNKFWMNQTEVPAILLKYEDLLDDPIKAFEPVRALLGIERDDLTAALKQASVATKPDGKFFWKQQENNYKNYLTRDQIERFIKYRGDDSMALGYSFDLDRT